MSINTTTETYDSFIKNIIETRGQFGCGEEYHERHHIIPKCLGGSNDKSNLILECCKGKRATAGGFRWGYND